MNKLTLTHCLKQRTRKCRSICLYPAKLSPRNVLFVRMICHWQWPCIDTWEVIIQSRGHMHAMTVITGLINNLHELSSHHLNHHHVKIISCKHCQFYFTTKAKMCQYVRSHTTGVKCTTCGKGFATITEILRHQHLHDEWEEFLCQDCDSVYHTRAALNIHWVGKHGPGYQCANCDSVFDTPIQCNRHQKCCI